MLDGLRHQIAQTIYDVSNRWIAPSFQPGWNAPPIDADERTHRLHLDYADTLLAGPLATALAEARAEGRRQGLEEAAKVLEGDMSRWVFTGHIVLRHSLEGIRRLLATSTPETGETWASIDSAPANKAIQVYVPGLDYYGNDGVYAGMLVDMGTGQRWMTFAWAMGRDMTGENRPTHWRPLPAPPALAANTPETGESR